MQSKNISEIFIIGDSFSDTQNGFMNKHAVVDILKSAIDSDPKYVLPLRY